MMPPAAAASRAPRPDVGPHPEGLRNANWSHRGPVAAGTRRPRPRRLLPVRAARPAATATPGPGGHGVPGRAARTPASLKGSSHTRRMKIDPPSSRSLLASRFLADECNRPDCQRASSTLTGRTSVLRRRPPTVVFTGVPPIPSAGASCLSASRPGRLDRTRCWVTQGQ